MVETVPTLVAGERSTGWYAAADHSDPPAPSRIPAALMYRPLGAGEGAAGRSMAEVFTYMPCRGAVAASPCAA